MPRLNCSASNCSFNNSNYCCKNQISVAGENTSTAQGTCCESFTESNGAFTNSTQTPNTYLSISCDAENCMYNCSKNCHAESISVSGVTASTAQQTECATFTTK